MHMNEKLLRLVDALIRMAEEESLSGVLSDGTGTAIRRYNAILATLVAQGDLPEGLFEPLAPDATFASLGVEAKLLRTYLDDDRPRHGPRHGHHEGHGEGHSENAIHALMGIAPFASREHLGEVVRILLAQGSRVDLGAITALAPFLDREDIGLLMKMQIENLRPKPAPEPPKAPEAPEPPKPPATSEWNDRDELTGGDTLGLPSPFSRPREEERPQ